MAQPLENQTALLAALTTEHFVQQTAISTTTSEMSSRASIYVMALSSALVAIGFAMQVPDMRVPFLAVVIPSVFVLGIFTVLRLVDIAAENMHAHIGIARIRAHYRTLGEAAAHHFAQEYGRWPENNAEPSLRGGPVLAYLTTAATMIALINALVAAAGVSLVAVSVTGYIPLALVLGAATSFCLSVLFYWYQRMRTRHMVHMARAYGSQIDVL